MPEKPRIRWRRFVLIGCLCAMMLAIGLRIELLTIHFHRKMRFWSHTAYAANWSSSATQRGWLLDHAEWHRDRLIDRGYLSRHVKTFRSPLPSVERLSMINKLYATMSQDCMWYMGKDRIGREYIEIYAPQPEMECHMALVESHDVAPGGGGSSEVTSE